MLKIEQYEFEEHPKYKVELHAIRGDLIIGSYKHENIYVPLIIGTDGKPWHFSPSFRINLVPYVKTQTKKMTMKEINQALGYEVEVVE